MRYLLIDVGCIECGNDTVVERISEDVPDDYQVVEVGASVKLGYAESKIAVPIP